MSTPKQIIAARLTAKADLLAERDALQAENTRLRELVAKWKQGRVKAEHGDMQMHGARWVVELCADELEANLAPVLAPATTTQETKS